MSSEAEEEEEKKAWTTWEELLLACAVERHGLRDWDSVAHELQNRTSSIPSLLTAQICRNKFQDLQRRFMDAADDQPEVFSIPWLDDLRKLRVAELKQEVHRYDLSIQSLQLKVKRLEEERDRSLNENQNDDKLSDLEKNLVEESSEDDKTDANAENVSDKSLADACRDEQSFNESNSTDDRVKEEMTELEPIQTDAVKPDRDLKQLGEDSSNDSSDTIAKYKARKPSQEKRTESDSAELPEPAADSKERSKESSDVQSSVSLTKKRRRRGEVSGSVGRRGVVEPAEASPAITTKEDCLAKSEPLVAVLDIIRSHKHGSLFERRLESQLKAEEMSIGKVTVSLLKKTEKYEKLVRQHVDLGTVKGRLGDGTYSSCPAKFYLDLFLIFNNAIVFFPKSSVQSTAAFGLRELVLTELRKNRKLLESESPPVQPKLEPEKSDSLLAKHKVSAPIIVCRKRSSMSAKPAGSCSSKLEKPAINPKPPPAPLPPPVKSSVSTSTTPNEKESTMKLKMKGKPVTGVRSITRKSSSNIRSENSVPRKNQNATNSSRSSRLPSANKKVGAEEEDEEEEVVPKTGKKRSNDAVAKKRGAAEFLKRIKKNSPEKLKNPATSTGDGKKRETQKRRLDEKKKDGMVRRNRVGRHAPAEEEQSPSKRGVGRPPKRGRRRGEGGDAEEASSNRPKTRNRRL